MSSAICFNLDQSKILSSGNGLIPVEPEYVSNKTDILSVTDMIKWRAILGKTRLSLYQQATCAISLF